MILFCKKCRHLSFDKDDRPFCKSTGICYKQVCFSDLYRTVIHSHNGIIDIQDK